MKRPEYSILYYCKTCNLTVKRIGSTNEKIDSINQFVCTQLNNGDNSIYNSGYLEKQAYVDETFDYVYIKIIVTQAIL